MKNNGKIPIKKWIGYIRVGKRGGFFDKNCYPHVGSWYRNNLETPLQISLPIKNYTYCEIK